MVRPDPEAPETGQGYAWAETAEDAALLAGQIPHLLVFREAGRDALARSPRGGSGLDARPPEASGAREGDHLSSLDSLVTKTPEWPPNRSQ